MLNVTRALIKARLGLTTTAEDAAIDACITDQLASFENSIDPDILANPAYLETLNAAANDWVAGEYSAQRIRGDGLLDTITIDGIEVKFSVRDPNDPCGLKSQAGVRMAGLNRRQQTARALAGGGMVGGGFTTGDA
jgi:hypothetical protein